MDTQPQLLLKPLLSGEPFSGSLANAQSDLVIADIEFMPIDCVAFFHDNLIVFHISVM